MMTLFESLADWVLGLLTIISNLISHVIKYLPPAASPLHDLSSIKRIPNNIAGIVTLIFCVHDSSDFFIAPVLGVWTDGAASELKPTEEFFVSKTEAGAQSSKGWSTTQFWREFAGCFPDVNGLDEPRARALQHRRHALARQRKRATNSLSGGGALSNSASSSLNPTPILKGTSSGSFPPSPLLVGSSSASTIALSGTASFELDRRDSDEDGDESGDATAVPRLAVRKRMKNGAQNQQQQQMLRRMGSDSLGTPPASPVPAPTICFVPHLVVPVETDNFIPLSKNMKTAAAASSSSSVAAPTVTPRRKLRLRRGVDWLSSATAPILAPSAAAAASELQQDEASDSPLSPAVSSAAAAAAGHSPQSAALSPPATPTASSNMMMSSSPFLNDDDGTTTDSTAAVAAVVRSRRKPHGKGHQRQNSLQGGAAGGTVASAGSAGGGGGGGGAASGGSAGGSVPRRVAAPPRGRPTLAIDLDETLLHSREFSIYKAPAPWMPTADFVEVVPDARGAEMFSCFVRPHVNLFLRTVSQWYNLTVFTASTAPYAATLTQRVDRLKVISPRRIFSRGDCTPSALTAGVGMGAASHVLSNSAQQSRNSKKHEQQRAGSSPRPSYLKDLTRIEPNLSQIVLLDNCPAVAFPGQAHNILSIPDFLPIDDCESRGAGGCTAMLDTTLDDGAASAASGAEKKKPPVPISSGLISDLRPSVQQARRTGHICSAVTDSALIDLLPVLEALHHVHDVRAILQHRKGQ